MATDLTHPDVMPHLQAAGAAHIYQRILFGDLTVGLTPVRLQAVITPAVSFQVQSDPDNAGNLFIRDGAVGVNNGFKLKPGFVWIGGVTAAKSYRPEGVPDQALTRMGAGFMPPLAEIVVNLADFWLVATAAGQRVHISWTSPVQQDIRP